MNLLSNLGFLQDHVDSLGVSEQLKVTWKQALGSSKVEALHALILVLLVSLEELGLDILYNNASCKSILGPLIQEIGERRNPALPE